MKFQRVCTQREEKEQQTECFSLSGFTASRWWDKAQRKKGAQADIDKHLHHQTALTDKQEHFFPLKNGYRNPCFCEEEKVTEKSPWT